MTVASHATVAATQELQIPQERRLIVACCCREQWLAAAQKVFQSLDSKSNGLTMERLMRVLREKLPAAEVEYAMEDALVDAGYKGDYSTSVRRAWDSLL